MIMNSKGMTLIESLVAAALVTMALGLAAYTLTQVGQNMKLTDSKINGKILLSRTISLLLADPGRFPRVTSGTLDGIYISCFDKFGSPLPIKDKLILTEIIFLSDYQTKSESCPGSAFFEIRVKGEAQSFTIDVVDYQSSELKVYNSETLPRPLRL